MMHPRRLAAFIGLFWFSLAAFLAWNVVEYGEVTSSLAGIVIFIAFYKALREMLDAYFPRNYGDEQ